MAAVDYRGVLPATITPFDERREVHWDDLRRYGHWLKSIPGIAGLVANGHAGEGTALSDDEREQVLRVLKEELGEGLPVIAGVVGDGTRIVVDDARRAAAAGADALLVFPAPSWLRFGYQAGAVQERHRAIYEATGLPMIMFQFPETTKATYTLDLLLELAAMEGVEALKDGARDMVRWDTEVPVLRRERPELAILTCQDEFLMHTMWESDGALVGYAALIPELMVELLEAARSHNYDRAKEVYDRMLPITKAVYHRESHIESTQAMKLGLVHREILSTATVRPPLMPLGSDAGHSVAAALDSAGVKAIASV
jgi:4-hydroxy-tetrahydrodipicolinate synthase